MQGTRAVRPLPGIVICRPEGSGLAFNIAKAAGLITFIYKITGAKETKTYPFKKLRFLAQSFLGFGLILFCWDFWPLLLQAGKACLLCPNQLFYADADKHLQ